MSHVFTFILIILVYCNITCFYSIVLSIWCASEKIMERTAYTYKQDLRLTDYQCCGNSQINIITITLLL